MAPPFDTSQVSPADVAVTLRSLRRRFGEPLARPVLAGGHGDRLHARPPDGGLSPVEHAAWTATALSMIAQALHHVLVESNPEVVLAPVDAAPPVDGGQLSAEAVLRRLCDTAEALAGVVADTHGTEWTRMAETPDGRQITALDIARLAVRISIEHLRAIEQAVDSFGSGADWEQPP